MGDGAHSTTERGAVGTLPVPQPFREDGTAQINLALPGEPSYSSARSEANR